jgi:formylmethanofuran dehydrogenase subunit A
MKIVNAEGKYVMPGGVDPHTHLDMPFMGQVTCDDFYRCQRSRDAVTDKTSAGWQGWHWCCERFTGRSDRNLDVVIVIIHYY